MKISDKSMPFWAIKRKGDDKGVYRIYKGNSKSGVKADLSISFFSLYNRIAGLNRKEKRFGYSAFQEFDEIKNLSLEMKKNLLIMVLENS